MKNMDVGREIVVVSRTGAKNLRFVRYSDGIVTGEDSQGNEYHIRDWDLVRVAHDSKIRDLSF